MLKIICDYTGVVQFRGSDEIGDAYWTLNMLLAIAATFESVHIHFKSVEDVGQAIPEETAWGFASVLGGAWVAVFLIFLVLMKKKYRTTFFYLETGNQWAQSYFLNEENSDESDIIATNGSPSGPKCANGSRRTGRAGLKRNRSGSTRCSSPTSTTICFHPRSLCGRTRLAAARGTRSSLGDRMGSVRRRSTAQVAPIEN